MAVFHFATDYVSIRAATLCPKRTRARGYVSIENAGLLFSGAMTLQSLGLVLTRKLASESFGDTDVAF